MSAESPFRILRRAPVASKVDELLVPSGIWALELQDGAQPGLRLGLDRDAGIEETIPFDARGRRIPLNGAKRVTLYWPSALTHTETLVLEAWTVPARYEHRDGQVERQPAILLLRDQEEAFAGPGTLTIGPWTTIPDALRAVGDALRLPAGGRLCANFGFVGAAAPLTCDAQLQARALGAATFRQVKAIRGVGAPSTPTNILHCDFDVPVPPGEFRFVLASSGAADVTSYIYARLGP